MVSNLPIPFAPPRPRHRNGAPRPGFFSFLEPYAREYGLLEHEGTSLWKSSIPNVHTEREIFAECKDAGAIGPEAYWTYAEDPIAPRTRVPSGDRESDPAGSPAKRSARRPRGSENPG